MKQIWKKIKTSWWKFWGIYEYDDDSIQHLSRSDKLSIWYGSFIMCMVTAGICLSILGINNFLISRQTSQAVEDMLSTIATYLAVATDNEYDEIAKAIRHDLVFSEYNKDIENLIRYIPNTSENCPTSQERYSAQAFLVCVNTGEMYPLDMYQKDEKPDEHPGRMTLSFGYDEISETRIHIITHQGAQDSYAEIHREQWIISAQKMKSFFCDDCIREILNAIDGQLLKEVVLFDAEQKIFLPIEDGANVQIGDYELSTRYDHGDFRINIKYVSE